MATTEEVKAALKWWRQFRELDVYKTDMAFTLADAYAEEHPPDDDEPAEFYWARGVIFEAFADSVRPLLYATDCVDKKGVLICSQGGDTLLFNPTRGSLRRLLKEVSK